MQIVLELRRIRVSPLRLAVVHAAIRRAALPFALSRLALLLVTAIASGGWPDLTRWRFWDGAFYSAIATGGYTSPGWFAWFPLWPLVERGAAAPFVGLSPAHPNYPAFFAGMLIADIACFAACVLLELLTPVHPRGLQISALLLTSPFAFFLAAPYTEALFLALAFAVFLALRRERFAVAVLCCALATALRPTGIALVAPLLLAWLQARGPSWRSLLSAVPLALASLTGLIAYALYCLARTGDALAFAHAQVIYDGHAFSWPWQTAADVWRAASAGVSLPLIADTFAVLCTCGVLLVGARRLPLNQALYAAAVALPVFIVPLPGSSDPLASAGRYMLTAFPAFLLLHIAARSRPRLTAALVSASALAQSGFALFELRHGWLP